MIKQIVERYVRASKNPNFKFDPNISDRIVWRLVVVKFISFVRGLKFIFCGKKFKKLFLGKSVELIHVSKIHLGENVVLGDYVKLDALCGESITIGDHVNIGAFSRIVISGSFSRLGRFIKIGSHVGLGEYSFLGGAGGLEIGDHSILGQYFSAHPENHNFSEKDKLIRHQGVSRQGIRIGADCWIGAKVTVLDGVTIGDHCVVAAGAVVTKSFGSGVLIGGVPAKVLREIA